MMRMIGSVLLGRAWTQALGQSMRMPSWVSIFSVANSCLEGLDGAVGVFAAAFEFGFDDLVSRDFGDELADAICRWRP